MGQDVGRHLYLAANEQRVVLANDGGELFGREADLLIDFMMGRRISMPCLARGSATRIFIGCSLLGHAEGLECRHLGGGHGRARNDGSIELDERLLENGHRVQNVRDRYVAEVPDPEDLALQGALAAGNDEPVFASLPLKVFQSRSSGSRPR